MLFDEIRTGKPVGDKQAQACLDYSVLGPIKEKEATLRAVWESCELPNERIRDTLGMESRSLDTSLRA